MLERKGSAADRGPADDPDDEARFAGGRPDLGRQPRQQCVCLGDRPGGRGHHRGWSCDDRANARTRAIPDLDGVRRPRSEALQAVADRADVVRVDAERDGPVGAARADLGRPGAVKGQCAGGRGGDRQQRRQCHEDRQAAGSRDSRGSHVRVPVSDGPGRHPASRPGWRGYRYSSIPASPAGPWRCPAAPTERKRARITVRVRACETPTVVRRRPTRHRRPPGYDRRMRSLPTVLLILSLPAGAIAYVVATRILSSLRLAERPPGVPDPDRATLRRGPRHGAIPHPVLRPQGEGGPRRAPASRGVGRGEWRGCLGRCDAGPGDTAHVNDPSGPDDPTAAR